MRKIILLVVICFSMCKQKPQSNDIIFVDMDQPEKASLFDYFSSIELIPLETSQDVLIAAISKIIFLDGKYYTHDPLQSIIHVFDHTGKFIFKIDKKGKGPGEYSHIEDFIINPFSNNFELLEAYGSVHLYDLSGVYIESKRVTYPDFGAVHKIAVVDRNTHVFFAMFEPKKIVYFNLDEKKLLNEEFEEDRNITRLAGRLFYQYHGDCYFSRPIHPIVYKIGSNQLEPAFQFDFGKYTREGTKGIFSEESKRNSKKYFEELFAQFPYVLRTVRHNDKYVMAVVARTDLFNNRDIVIYEKNKKKSKFISEFTEKVKFDMDIVTDEYVLRSCQWVDLEDYVSKEMLDDKNIEVFEKLLQAKMELNPILIKYWFK